MLHPPQDQLTSTQCIKATSEIDSSNVFHLKERSSVAESKLSHKIVILELPAKTCALLPVVTL